MLESLKSTARSILVFLHFVENPDYIYKLVDEHPVDEEMDKNTIYVVGGKGYQKWAYFRCPTDNTEVIQLSLMQKHRPRWSILSDWLGRPTIHPSVRQTDGSFAHFWIKSGKVHICGDSGKRPLNHDLRV